MINYHYIKVISIVALLLSIAALTISLSTLASFLFIKNSTTNDNYLITNSIIKDNNKIIIHNL